MAVPMFDILIRIQNENFINRIVMHVQNRPNNYEAGLLRPTYFRYKTEFGRVPLYNLEV